MKVTPVITSPNKSTSSSFPPYIIFLVSFSKDGQGEGFSGNSKGELLKARKSRRGRELSCLGGKNLFIEVTRQQAQYALLFFLQILQIILSIIYLPS
jgi:hypothetical protein